MCLEQIYRSPVEENKTGALEFQHVRVVESPELLMPSLQSYGIAKEKIQDHLSFVVPDMYVLPSCHRHF